jgi:hypothetical protein
LSRGHHLEPLAGERERDKTSVVGHGRRAEGVCAAEGVRCANACGRR